MEVWGEVSSLLFDVFGETASDGNTNTFEVFAHELRAPSAVEANSALSMPAI